MNTDMIYRGMLRLLMVFFWIGICVLFLFAPLAVEYIMPTSKTINILTWPLVIDPKRVADFERATGIKVRINYYEKNEELFTKLMITKGRGYDLIITTDFSVEQLIEQQLVKKIDHSQLSFWPYVRPGMLGHYHDVDNLYSVPYFVSMYGLGVDRNAFAGDIDPSWALIFDEKSMTKEIGMIEDMREAIFIAGQYLYNTDFFIEHPQWSTEIETLLKKQKKWVYLYTDARVEDLLTARSVPVAVAMSVDIWKVKREHPAVDFVLPKEGGYLVMESFVVPTQSQKDDLVYQFINYVCKPEVVKHHVQLYGFCPSLTNVDSVIPASFCVSDEQMRSMAFFTNIIPKKVVNDMRIAVMAY